MFRRLGAIGSFILVACLCLDSLQAAESWKPAPQRFRQEFAQQGAALQGLPPGPIALLDVSPNAARTIRVLTGGIWYFPDVEKAGGEWYPVDSLRTAPGSKEVRIASPQDRPLVPPIPIAEIRQLVRAPDELWVVAERSLWRYQLLDGNFQSVPLPPGVRIHQAARSAKGMMLLATDQGLHRNTGSAWERWVVEDGKGRTWGSSGVLGVAFDDQDEPWFCLEAGVARHTPAGWQFYDGRDGLPWNQFTGMAAGPNGAMWFGTRRGLIRWDGSDWHYRQGKLWLPEDQVDRVVADGQGEAWVGSTAGVGRIGWYNMKLKTKADRYEKEIERYIKRTELGYVAEGYLTRPGDITSSTRSDSDNDGLWTAMYGAGECFGYGATRDPAILARAKQAFEALRFLQKVTQGGSHAPPKGFVARTVLEVGGRNPNDGRKESDQRERERDALWKVYEPRWPISADGKWYWKSDTSSDELDGHYFFLGLYYDLCAETPAEKERVREMVRDLTDHLIDHKFNLVDHDGTPTRWGVFGPTGLNGDPRWWAERGLNSLSMLSYLTVAGFVTGDPKYEKAVNELVTQHGYSMNLMYPKVQSGPGSGNHSDDEMAFMSYYSLLRYSKNEALKSMVRLSFFRYWLNEAPEMNPLFNFMYAAHGLGEKVRIVWGEVSVEPLPDWHSDSMATLHGFPLDRIEWGHFNSHRLDVIRTQRTQQIDFYHPDHRVRGSRVNGKVLPVENRFFHHWNSDPWTLDESGSGTSLGSGTVFLLPYYMGMYHGFIEKPQ